MRSSSAAPASANDHPLAMFKDIPAVIDDRIHAFVCRAAMSGNMTLRPSLLCTQVSESLGGSDVYLVGSRILAHCGEGELLTALAMAKCPACGKMNRLEISPNADLGSTIMCEKCDKAFSIKGIQADESLTINRDFCAYLCTIAGRPA